MIYKNGITFSCCRPPLPTPVLLPTPLQKYGKPKILNKFSLLPPPLLVAGLLPGLGGSATGVGNKIKSYN